MRGQVSHYSSPISRDGLGLKGEFIVKVIITYFYPYYSVNMPTIYISIFLNMSIKFIRHKNEQDNRQDIAAISRPS